MAKAFDLLARFNKSERHWFKKYLESSYFNKDQSILHLYLQFFQYSNRKKSENISKKFVSFLSDTIDVNKSDFHRSCNYLLKNAEDFLAWQGLKNDEFEQNLQLLKAYKGKHMPDAFSTAHRKAEKGLEASPVRNAGYFRKRYQLSLESYDQLLGSGSVDPEGIQAISNWHDLAFMAEKLKNACILISRQRVAPRLFDTGLLQYIINYLKERPDLLEHNAIAVYYHGFHALLNPEKQDHFFALKTQLAEASESFEKTELREIYLLAINYCVHQINLREEKFLSEVFELYKKGLEDKVFLEEGYISRLTYTNITLAGLRLKEYSWTYDFLRKYREVLPEGQRAGVFAFNMAKYYLETGNSEASMELLQEMDTDVVVLNLTAKAMLIRIYTEAGAHKALESLLSSLKIYLQRKRELNPQQRSAYQNLIRFVRRYTNLLPSNKKGLSSLYKEVEACTLLAEKDWLTSLLSSKLQ